MNAQVIDLRLNWLPLIFAFAVSLLVTSFFSVANFQLGKDKNSGIQKFHTKSTSRLGGVGIGLGLIAGVCLSFNFYSNDALLGVWLLIASLPVFMGGLFEDLTHKVSPRIRLWLACVSSGAVYIIFNVGVSRTDITLLDLALNVPGVAFVLTLLVVAGFVNAINIIDGFHGLASGTVMIMLLAMAILAYRVDDGLVLRLSLITFAATAGFALWNWPFGKIFLGDGGAYLLGLWVVELGLLLPHRTETLSPMAPVLIGVYPLLETLYSMYRRKFVRSHPVNHPDALHLHTLIYKRLILNPEVDKSEAQKNKANSKVAYIAWCFALVPGLLSCCFYEQTLLLLFLIVVFALAYIYLYKQLVKFKSPLLLMAKNRRL